mmetsp:Transcript_21177/g.54611  ORF Transcript_21177/g.54611 Transcript_21177/m.54611 type:complete len:214 (-) Transcript_21177:657-1298(-)
MGELCTLRGEHEHLEEDGDEREHAVGEQPLRVVVQHRHQPQQWESHAPVHISNPKHNVHGDADEQKHDEAARLDVAADRAPLGGGHGRARDDHGAPRLDVRRGVHAHAAGHEQRAQPHGPKRGSQLRDARADALRRARAEDYERHCDEEEAEGPRGRRRVLAHRGGQRTELRLERLHCWLQRSARAAPSERHVRVERAEDDEERDRGPREPDD